jgi:aminoglycoside phosphotransferase (APT) family kinase protein
MVNRAESAADASAGSPVTATIDVIGTGDEALGLSQPPLVVLEPLRRLLDELGLGTGPLSAEPLGAGHSNVTYLLRRDSMSVVLRRPPRPPYAESAHDVLREARIMMAARDAGLPVPQILALVDDISLLGVPFVLVEHVSGHAISSTLPDGFGFRSDARAISERLVDTLADIHAVDVTIGPLATVGRPSGYLERQLRRFAAIWEEVKTRELPVMDALAAWLIEHRPQSSETTLVHGDFRLGNVLFAPGRPARLVAVLDWEMATLGDPLADLGYLCATWADPGEAEHPMTALSAATRGPGFARAAELAARYAERTGRERSDLSWYQVLALWKSAIFLEASHRRYLAGTTTDPYFGTLGEGVPRIAAAAEMLAR